MEHNELKPCPFCGGKAVIRKYDELVGHGMVDTYYFAKCKSCKMRGRKFGILEAHTVDDRIKKAINAWNRRAENGK